MSPGAALTRRGSTGLIRSVSLIEREGQRPRAKSECEMLHIVTAENRHLFRDALMEMHLQRKALFIDQLGWDLEASEGLEIDAYDAEDACYLIEAETPRSSVKASARLLRTDRPHLMSEVFPHLCRDAVPRADNIWEASRFCPHPDTPKGPARRALLALMVGGIMETALLFGVDRISFVASAALSPLVRNVGWRASPLGAPARAGRDRVTAMIAEIDALGLRRVRANNRLSAPITRFAPGDFKQAA